MGPEGQRASREPIAFVRAKVDGVTGLDPMRLVGARRTYGLILGLERTHAWE